MSDVFFKCGQAHFNEVQGRGLIVEQEGRAYLARSWELTPDFKEVVSIIMAHGLSCTIRDTHPRPDNRNTNKGVEYVAFSRSPDERWIIALDQYSERRSIEQVTVEKGYEIVLQKAGLSFKWQRGGGKNIFVKRDLLSKLLQILSPEMVDKVEH